MTLQTLITPARTILTMTAVTAVAAACLGSAATSSSATAGQDRPDRTSATKEWRVVAPTATYRTKEW